ncbi:MAG: pilus assembly protein PilM [Candidatus Omnitrophica bacterium]|nr:pilus assembly protein PilM [Candidatus Omnitrophota bacterium]
MKIKGLKFSKIVSKSILGIEFTKSRVKLALLEALPHNEKIVSLIQRDISNLADSEISNLLLSIFDTLPLKPVEIIDIIDPSFLITKNIEIPSVDPQEIKEIVNLQAGRHTPYSRDEIIVDYINIGVYRRNYSRILLVIVARNIIKRHLDILEKTNLNPIKIVFSCEGLALNSSRILKTETENLPLGLIHIDEENTDFLIIFRNKPIFIRSIPIGSKHLIFEKEKYQLRFLEEISRSKEAYQIEDVERNPNSFILTGSIDALLDLEKSLADILHLNVQSISYLRNLNLSEEIIRDSSFIKTISFLNAVSSIISLEKLKVDLIPEEIKLKKAIQIRAKELLKSGILVLSIFIFLFIILLTKIYFKGLYLGMLDKRYNALMQEAKGIEEDFSKISLIKNFLSERGFSLEILYEIYRILPSEIELTDIRFDKEGKFSLRGTSTSMSLVFSFVDSLEKSEYFKDVKTRYTTKRKSGTRDFTDFEITSNLNKPSQR